jgi:hypothetical protein
MKENLLPKLIHKDDETNVCSANYSTSINMEVNHSNVLNPAE